MKFHLVAFLYWPIWAAFGFTFTGIVVASIIVGIGLWLAFTWDDFERARDWERWWRKYDEWVGDEERRIREEIQENP